MPMDQSNALADHPSEKRICPTVYQRDIRHILNIEIYSLPVYELSLQYPNSV